MHCTLECFVTLSISSCPWYGMTCALAPRALFHGIPFARIVLQCTEDTAFPNTRQEDATTTLYMEKLDLPFGKNN